MQKAILNIIKRNNKVTLQDIANELGKTRDGIKYHITKMQKEGILRHIGKDNDGHWEIVDR